MSDPREYKLPVWAQGMIADLRRDRDNAKRDAIELRQATKPEETTVILDRYDEHPIGIPVGEHSYVRFRQPGQDCAYFDVRLEGSELKVMGATSLLIRPNVTNYVGISLTDRFGR